MGKADLKPGDSIRLNDLARMAFRDRDITVDEVKGWGVECHMKDAQGFIYYYRAPWEQIQGIAL